MVGGRPRSGGTNQQVVPQAPEDRFVPVVEQSAFCVGWGGRVDRPWLPARRANPLTILTKPGRAVERTGAAQNKLLPGDRSPPRATQADVTEPYLRQETAA